MKNWGKLSKNLFAVLWVQALLFSIDIVANQITGETKLVIKSQVVGIREVEA